MALSPLAGDARPSTVLAAVQSAPVSWRKAATADSIVGKKCAGSMVRVRLVAFDLAPDRVLHLGEDQADPVLAFSASSRSSSMSAAVVSTSVIGSAATRIHVGGGSARGHPPDLVAEGRGVGEEQRAVEPVDHQAGQLPRLRVAVHVVVAREARHPAEVGLRTATRPGGRRSGSTARRRWRSRAARRAATTPRNAAIDSRNSALRCRHSRTVPGMSASDSDAAMTTAASVGLRQVPEQAGYEHQHQR